MPIRVETYVPGTPPALTESQKKFIQNELSKIKKVLDSMRRAIEELDERTTP